MDLCSFDTAGITASQLCHYYHIVWFPVATVLLLYTLCKHTKNDGLCPEALAILHMQARQQTDAMNAYYQAIKSTKQQPQVLIALRCWSCGYSSLPSPGCNGAGLLVYHLCKCIYFVLCLNNVKHCFSAQLERDKKPEITSGGTVLCQIELNGCWQKLLMGNRWFSLPCHSVIAESGMSYQNIIAMISLTSSVGFPLLTQTNIV